MLFRKMIRTMGRYRAQFISMIIMIALGIGVFVGFNIEWYTIEQDTAKAFRETGFSDYRILSEKGFSKGQLQAVLSIPGVEDATRFLAVNTTVKGDSDIIALNVAENPAVSGFIVTSGEEYDAESKDGIWLSDRYAEQNGIAPGDGLTLTYSGFSLSGTVRGLIKSGEYLICVPDETQLMPDFDTYGFAYISPAMLRRAVFVEFYSQINVRSALDKAEFSRLVDEALGTTALIVGKEDTISYAEAMGESEEGKTMGSILPVLFLAIAVLTMVTTMHRLTASEKTQIGTLKALGFKDRRIARHYSVYALAVGLLGTALGIGIGWWLGWFIMNPGGSMGTYMDMQDWSLHAPPFIWIVLLLINLFLLLIGLASVRSMLRGTAADALRPYVPRRQRRILLERLPLWDRLSFGSKWNLRDAMRHKARTGMTLFGIVGCMILLVGGLGMQDTMNGFVDAFYHRAICYETRVNLDLDAVDNESAQALAEELGADWSAASSIQIDGDAFSLEVDHTPHDLVRFLDGDMKTTRLTDEGAFVSSRIARKFGLKPGDELTFSPYGEDTSYTVPVAGVLRSLTESVFMTEAFAARAGIDYRINTLYTNETGIASDRRIVNTQSRQSIIDSFDSFMEVMVMMIWLLVIAAVVLGIVVLYNLGVMSYTERYREMATLKVIGFKDRRISRLLIGQNMAITVLGVVIGIPAGVGVLRYLLDALAGEYEMILTLGPATFLVSTLLTFGVSLLVGFMVARKNKRIDMVEALKGQE